MRRTKHLYGQITATENLYAAVQAATKGRKRKVSIRNFLFRKEYEVLTLQKELTTHSYKPGKYKTFRIYDPKPRMISAAPVRDRVVHHALCRVVEPIFERYFIHDTYANRKGKGSHAAVNRLQQFMKGNQYALKMDIRSYFPSIDHEILKEIIARKIGCQPTLWLINTIIDNSNAQEPVPFSFGDNNLFSALHRRKGLPIGNLTSQFFANIYLSPLDHFVKNELHCKHYIRYVDDFVLLHPSKAQLYVWKQQIIAFLENYLLKVHPNKCQVMPIEQGIPFLGYRTFRFHRLLPKSNVRRLKIRTHLRYRQWQHGYWVKKKF